MKSHHFILCIALAAALIGAASAGSKSIVVPKDRTKAARSQKRPPIRFGALGMDQEKPTPARLLKTTTKARRPVHHDSHVRPASNEEPVITPYKDSVVFGCGDCDASLECCSDCCPKCEPLLPALAADIRYFFNKVLCCDKSCDVNCTDDCTASCDSCGMHNYHLNDVEALSPPSSSRRSQDSDLPPETHRQGTQRPPTGDEDDDPFRDDPGQNGGELNEPSITPRTLSPVDDPLARTSRPVNGQRDIGKYGFARHEQPVRAKKYLVPKPVVPQPYREQDYVDASPRVSPRFASHDPTAAGQRYAERYQAQRHQGQYEDRYQDRYEEAPYQADRYQEQPAPERYQADRYATRTPAPAAPGGLRPYPDDDEFSFRAPLAQLHPSRTRTEPGGLRPYQEDEDWERTRRSAEYARYEAQPAAARDYPSRGYREQSRVEDPRLVNRSEQRYLEYQQYLRARSRNHPLEPTRRDWDQQRLSSTQPERQPARYREIEEDQPRPLKPMPRQITERPQAPAAPLARPTQSSVRQASAPSSADGVRFYPNPLR